jgi:hypothetical protein
LGGDDGPGPPGVPGDRRGQRAGEWRDGLLYGFQQRGQLAQFGHRQAVADRARELQTA